MRIEIEVRELLKKLAFGGVMSGYILLTIAILILLSGAVTLWALNTLGYFSPWTY